ncbi:FecR family protein [Peristeroidobacter soli]|uniref:FecR family protein n=1 Tax=Peristeroidobacter soli TaxID=2497877 RepID=UPI00101CE5B0|nr:FecR domain-containing protein [Peristeroidobacter soli]
MRDDNAMRAGRTRSIRAVLDEAAEWAVVMAAAEVSIDDRREFVAWLKRSPEHLKEYLSIDRSWAELRGVDAARRIDVEALLAEADANVVELDVTKRAAVASDRVEVRGGSPMRALGIAFAATVIAALVGVSWFESQWEHRYSTGVGEQRTVKLDDGSTVVLNTHTRIRVAFTDQTREVRLLEGEALFEVAKNVARPFRVVSGRAITQAVGTAFVVRQEAEHTSITVIEGQVAVLQTESGERPPAELLAQAQRVSAGVRADVADRGISTVAIENSATATAWRSGQLVFDGSTLADMVAEFNRYNRVQLVLRDSQLANQRLSGVFAAAEPQALVSFLEHSGVIEPAQPTGNEIILVPRR